MNLSNVIKTGKGNSQGKGVYSTDAKNHASASIDKFLSFDELWQSEAGAPIDPMQPIREEEERVKRECAEMIRNAEGRVQQIEQDAYKKGFDEGKKEALAQEKVVLTEKATQLDGLIREIETERSLLYSQYERDMLILLSTLLDRLTEHEVSVNPLVIQACLKKALSFVVENSLVRVHLHTNDFQKIKQAGLENPKLFDGFSGLELVEDPSVSEGGCLLDTNFGEIDATIEGRKEKLNQAIEATFLQALSDT